MDAVESVRGGINKVADSIGGDTGEQIKDVTNRAAAAGSDMAEAVGAHAKTVLSELESTARKNPLMALGGALLVGMVLSMLMRRSD